MSIKMNDFPMANHVIFIEKPLDKFKMIFKQSLINQPLMGSMIPSGCIAMSNDHYEQLDGCEVEPNGISGTDEGDYSFDWD